MSNPKRVWDSKKRAVRQWKEQVWLVDWEKVVNTNHWFAEATWEDVVYDSSWEVAQEPLKTYDNWWSEDVPSGSSLTINTTLSQATGEVGSQISIYLLCENPITLSDPAPVLEFVELVQETWEWYNKIAKYRVVAEGTKTLSFSDNITWDSDSIVFTGTPAPAPYVVNENTILYAPLTTDFHAENLDGNITPEVLQNGGTITDWYAYFNADWALRYNIESVNKLPMTISAWVKVKKWDSDWKVAWYHDNFSNQGVSNVYEWFTTDVAWNPDKIWWAVEDGWSLFTVVYKSDNTEEVYVDWVSQWTATYLDTATTIDKIYLWGRYTGGGVWSPWYWDISQFIVDSVAWTAQEIADYYEATKDNYPVTLVESASFSDDDPINVVAWYLAASFNWEYSPVNADKPKTQIRLEASDSSIIEIVDGSLYIGEWQIAGEVQGLSEGTATINLYVNDVLADQKTVVVSPFIHVQSISQWEATMSIRYDTYWRYAVPYTPNDATDPGQDISADTDDTSIAIFWGIDTGWILLKWTGVWTTTLRYWLATDPETVYQATVTVTWWPIQQISNITQSISVENGTSTKVKLFDYLPTDANFDNVIVYNWNYYNISDFLLENGEYSVMINWTSEWTENLKFEFEGTEYQIPLTVTAPTPSYTFTNSIQESNSHAYCFSDGTQGSPSVVVWDDNGTTTVQTDGIFSDARYTVEIDPDDYHNAWEYIFWILDPTQVTTLMTHQTFDQATWAALQDLYNNPSSSAAVDAQTALVTFLGWI